LRNSQQHVDEERLTQAGVVAKNFNTCLKNVRQIGKLLPSEKCEFE